jgi:hypothetical protein
MIWRSEFVEQVCREQAYDKLFAVGFWAVAVGFRPAANKLIPVVSFMNTHLLIFDLISFA